MLKPKSVFIYVDAHGNEKRNNSLLGLIECVPLKSYLTTAIKEEIGSKGFFHRENEYEEYDFLIYKEYSLR